MINHPRLNLASGQTVFPGFLNIDKVRCANVNEVVDLEVFPWPIESDSAERIICNQYVEHIPHDTYAKRLVRMVQLSSSWEEFQRRVYEIDLNAPSDGLILFMDEVYRIMKVGGMINISTPYYLSDICWRDPTHVRAMTEVTFRYFNKKWRDNSLLDHYGINSDFDFHLRPYDFYEGQIFTEDHEREIAVRYYNNVIACLHVWLTKRKN